MKYMLSDATIGKILSADDVGAAINHILYETAKMASKRYEILTKLVNEGIVTKEMVVYEGKTIQFGEKISSDKMDEMYKKAEKNMHANIGEKLTELVDSTLSEDVQLALKLAAAIKTL